MSIGVYKLGTTRRIDLDFTDANGAAADPTTVELHVTRPDGTVRSYTYNLGSPTEIQRDGTGSFYYDALLDQGGDWYYVAVGTGAVLAVDRGQLMVEGHGITL